MSRSGDERIVVGVVGVVVVELIELVGGMEFAF